MSYPPPSSPQNDDARENAPAPPLPHIGVAPPTMPDYAYRSPLAGVVAAALSSENPHPLRYLAGAALGLIVGLLGAWIYSKFVYYTHFELALLTSLIGFGVGYAVVIGSGRGGLISAFLGAVISLFSILSSTIMLVNAHLSAKAGEMIFIRLTANTLPLIFSDMNPLSLLIIGIGVYGGFITPYRAGKAQASLPRSQSNRSQ